MSFISLCHTAETVEVPLRSSSNPFPNIYYPCKLFSSEDSEVENFGHVASKLIEAWIVLCSSSSSRPENPRLQRNPRSSSSGINMPSMLSSFPHTPEEQWQFSPGQLKA
jgi:hypothetical protein